MNQKVIKLGLFRDRHMMPEVSGYIFNEKIKDITDIEAMSTIATKALSSVGLLMSDDWLELYTTGLTVAAMTVVNVCCRYGIRLRIMHYNSQTGKYFPQLMYTREGMDLVDINKRIYDPRWKQGGEMYELYG